MRTVFFNQEGRLRNGWWILGFLAVIVACMAAFQLVIPILKRHGIKNGDWVVGVLFLFSMVATWFCTRLRKEPMASAGWRLDGRWALELGWGFLLGGGAMLLASGLIWAVGGVTWELDAARSLRTLGLGFLVFILVALWEENLFRGFLFQRLVNGLGEWPAQLILALFFGIAHWGNPGMQGATKLWATLGIALAAVFMGLAYLRTRSLAMPIGIHLAWNWVQGNVLGFGVSGTTQHGWLRPVFHGKGAWLSGGAFGPEASLFGSVAVLAGIFMLWAWKGRPTVEATTDVEGASWRPESA